MTSPAPKNLENLQSKINACFSALAVPAMCHGASLCGYRSNFESGALMERLTNAALEWHIESELAAADKQLAKSEKKRGAAGVPLDALVIGLGKMPTSQPNQRLSDILDGGEIRSAAELMCRLVNAAMAQEYSSHIRRWMAAEKLSAFHAERAEQREKELDAHLVEAKAIIAESKAFNERMKEAVATSKVGGTFGKQAVLAGPEGAPQT